MPRRIQTNGSYFTDTFFHIETIPGGREGAIFYVDPIDRDALEREVFQLSIIAYKYDNESFYESANVVIIVNDINDQVPEPLFEEYHIKIPEETPLTLNFEQEFGFHDRDLVSTALYQQILFVILKLPSWFLIHKFLKSSFHKKYYKFNQTQQFALDLPSYYGTFPWDLYFKRNYNIEEL